MSSLDAIIEMQEERNNSSQYSVQTTRTFSTISQGPPPPPAAAWPTPYQSIQYFCEYCSKSYDSQAHLERHCVTFEHQGNVNSDKDHQWNYRQPPWNVRNGQYRLCPAYGFYSVSATSRKTFSFALFICNFELMVGN